LRYDRSINEPFFWAYWVILGAGASYEIGMPLVWDLTEEIKRCLPPEKLRRFNASWRIQGGGCSDESINYLVSLLAQDSLHYEIVLGHLETKFRQENKPQSDYHYLYLFLVQALYFMFYNRHVQNAGHIQQNIRYLEGISVLASRNKPLWIFSLNHDVVIECLAATVGIPLNCGFQDEVITIPRQNQSGSIIGQIQAEVLFGDRLENSSLPFFPSGVHGINLMKIHGSLDVFTFRDGKDLLRIRPLSNDANGVLEALRVTNDELFYPVPGSPNGKFNALNEIAYTDDEGECQFLRRTLLSGAYKYDRRLSQVLPLKLLDHFGENLNNLTTLICVGYGFGDNHINVKIHRWLEQGSFRRIEIVSPNAVIPPFLQALASQISLVNMSATGYFDHVGGITRTRKELLDKRLSKWMLGQSNRNIATSELQSFFTEHQQEQAKVLTDWLKTLPVKNGDIDLDTLGLTQNELIVQGQAQAMTTPEDILEAFLLSRIPPV
jgi:hypothetical protein